MSQTAASPSASSARRSSLQAWVVYIAGVFSYIVAVMQRSTLGVAGVAAAERFEVDAALLSSLGVLQLAIYAGMQIPVGMLIDRIGARRLLIIGTVIMLAGQILVGFAPDIVLAVCGRILVGAGDATIFASLVRLTAAWFSGPILSSLFQWIGALGQIGQILSAVPFAWLLNQSGWTTAFLSAASCSVIALVVLVVAIPRGTKQGAATRSDRPPQRALALLGQALTEPGTRLGFWTTWTAQASGFMFTLMWGFPFMVYGLGLSPNTAALMLVVTVVVGSVAGPTLGLFSARFPHLRVRVILLGAGAMGLIWGAIILWPAIPPLWLLLVLLVAFGITIPSGVMGFDHALDYNPPECLGSANGIVNMGGFVPAVILILTMGMVLDWHQRLTGTSGLENLYSISGFRVAFLVQYLVVAFGAFYLLRARRQVRRKWGRKARC